MSWADPTVPAPDTGEEELLQPQQLPSRAGLVVAVLGFAALVLFLAVHSRQGTAGQRRIPSSAPTGVTSAPVTPGLVALPTGSGCPAGATCSRAVQLPVDTVAALYSVLPDVAVAHSISVLANRPGHFQPDLLSRRVDGEFDGAQMVLHVVRTSGVAPVGTRPVARAVSTRLGALATARQPGFVVTITVHGDTATVRNRLHRATTLSILRHLVADRALLEPL